MKFNKVRFLVAAITTFSAYAVYLSRINLSIAIIAMVDDNYQHHPQQQHLSQNQNQNQLNEMATRAQFQANQTAALARQIVTSPQDERAGRRRRRPDDERSSPIGSLNSTMSESLHSAHQQEPLAPIFPLKGKKSFLIMSRTKFDWNQSQQGQILGAFFFGYILIQIPGARMAESVGARWIIMAATFGSALISLAFPLSTQLNSIYLLMLLRFVMGLCQSAFFPAAYVLFCRWLPERERSILLPVMFIGSNVGSISSYVMSAYLISSDYGWPSVFYLSGLVCLLVSGAWCLVGSSGPEDNWLISDQERRFILSNVNNQSSERSSLMLDAPSSSGELATVKQQPESRDNDNHESEAQSMSQLNKQLNKKKRRKNGKLIPGHERAPPADSGKNSSFKNKDLESQLDNQAAAIGLSTCEPPEPSWSKLISSVPVWTLILSMYGNEWSNVVLCYELPTYLNLALTYPIERNGVINSFFQFSYAVSSPIMSSLGAYMLDQRVLGMHKIHVRKLFQSLATFGQLACFLGIAVCGLNVDLIILLMFASIVFRSCANAGDIMVAGDLSPEFAGTIFAFANSVGNTAGFVVPLFAGFIVKNGRDHDQWTPFWLTTACIMGASGLIFLVFGETRRQDLSLDLPVTNGHIIEPDVELIKSKMATNTQTARKLVPPAAAFQSPVAPPRPQRTRRASLGPEPSGQQANATRRPRNASLRQTNELANRETNC